ncbi:DUF1203 domain-containing protein [Sphingomonas sp.]|uniref:DUF1203 domain-containing protein n=1 Tax=Sphingomonas sp. TaxID=28214 RepID=UPI00286BA74D|nr:DUF1203 domain-containing protein [Sphingomonas sp.]
MRFSVQGLSSEPFQLLYGLSDDKLASHRARRLVVDGSGFPERIEMRDARPGETLLLVNFEHQDADTPYRSSHAVYVREGATAAWSGDHLPDVMCQRLLSLRGFSAEGTMINADVVEGSDAEPVIARLFGDPSVAYIHAHYAKPGCYAARIDRA